MSDKDIIYFELVQLHQLSAGQAILSLEEANLLSQHIWWLYLAGSKTRCGLFTGMGLAAA